MMNRDEKFVFENSEKHGVVLMVVMVVLVVLSIMGYTISEKVSAHRHRQQYMIDYQACLYARDSAVKYALANLADINEPNLVIRADVPDFSDTFLMSETEIQNILNEWAKNITTEQIQQYLRQNKSFDDPNQVKDVNLKDINDINEINDINFIPLAMLAGIDMNDINDANLLQIPGPYGAVWPLITKPLEIQVGTATVKIEIHDENAKYPLGWAMLVEPNVRREAAAGFRTFAEWMSINKTDADELESQLLTLNEFKKYQLEFKEIRHTKREEVKTLASRRRTTGARRRPTRYRTIVTIIPMTVHYADMAKMFNSSLINTEVLAAPTIISPGRNESAMKYTSIWGAGRININSAPRNVLEAAFTFGGDAQQIAQGIIKQRRLKPFKDIEELKESLFRFSDSIEKSKDFIATRSDFFTIRITADSGAAKVSAVIAVRKFNNNFEKIGVFAG